MTFSFVDIGDPRTRLLCDLLCAEGHRAVCFSEIPAAVKHGGAVVLPLKGVDPVLAVPFCTADITLVTGEDFLSREDFAQQNALPTAEGALEILLRETERTINDANILLIGYGRVGKCLCSMLRALGANVTTKEKDDDVPATLAQFDMVVNTAPAVVLRAEEMLTLSPHCFLLDLASQPGGFDKATAQKAGLRLIHALGLPAVTAPYTGAKIMRNALIAVLEERRKSA